MIFIGWGMMWLALGIAITMAIYITGDWRLLWFFLLPGLFRLGTKD